MKKILSVLLAVCLLLGCFALTVSAASLEAQQKADALYLLGLFKGTDKGYELDKTLTREQGIVMLLRLIGKETEALATTADCPFDDVYDWAKPYIAYAYEKGITLGVSEDAFGYGQKLTDAQFLTMLLRALGYDDTADDAPFTWDNPYELSKDVGLISEAEADASFTRGDMVEVCYNLLKAPFNGEEKTVVDQLKEDGVVTEQAETLAEEVASGEKELDDALSELPATETPSGNDPDDNGGGGGGKDSGDNGGGGGGGGETAPEVHYDDKNSPEPTPGPSVDPNEPEDAGLYETEDVEW